MLPRRFWCYQYQSLPGAMPRHLHLRAYHLHRHQHRRYVRARRRGQSLIAWLDTAARLPPSDQALARAIGSIQRGAPRLLVCPW